MPEPRATVAILTRNPGPRLAEVLDAVTGQVAPFEYETLVIDSGSTDGTDRLVRGYGVRFLSIDPEEFQHGRTRNLACDLSRGEFVAFLTHDATPASPFWLRDLVSGFEVDDSVAAVFGPHLPRPDCDVFTARDTLLHFRNFGPGDRPTVQEIAPTPGGWEEYRAREPILGFFSDVNGCIRRSVWRRIPYRELDYAEDQRLGRDLLEAGYKKVYCPTAAVYHSHAHSLREYFRRMYDEFVGLRVAVGYEERRSLLGVVGESIRVGRADAAYARSLLYLSLWRRWALGLYGLARAFLRRLAAYLALRHERMPAWTRRRLSLEGRERQRFGHLLRVTLKVLREYGPAEVWRLAVRRVLGWLGRKPSLPPSPPMPYARVDPRSPAPLLGRREAPKSLTLNWVTPPFGIASGGHMTISRIIHLLERFGHHSRIYLYHPSEWMHESDAAAERKMMRKFFLPMEAEVYVGVDDLKEADALIATSWETAYLIHQLGAARARCYFVQDFEPDFYPVGSDSTLAENTYRFGFHCLTAGTWLAELLRERYGATATPFDLAPDHDVYHPAPRVKREERTVLFYGRWKTERRGFEIATHAFELLAEREPGVRILIFGAESLPKKLPFPHRNLGILTPAQLAGLYNEATVGFVISLTNPSLIPLEMMACRLPVVDVDTESTRAFFGPFSDSLALAGPYPTRIADDLVDLLRDPERRERLADRGHEYASTLSWERSARQVEQGIVKALRP